MPGAALFYGRVRMALSSKASPPFGAGFVGRSKTFLKKFEKPLDNLLHMQYNTI
jgi:hypothetical protein